MSDTISYVYCVVAPPFDAADAPRGLDNTLVRYLSSSGVAALVSSLDCVAYDGDAVAQSVENAEWLTPRAIRHDAVVTWAADHGPVIPFSMWAMFGDDVAVSEMLAERSAELQETLERVSGAREFLVRVAADAGALTAAAQSIDLRLRELEERASLATPGQAYLLRRKLAESRKAAERDTALLIAEQTHDALAASSRSSVVRATPAARQPGVLLDGAYLVDTVHYDEFRAELTRLMDVYQPAGVQFAFTGPWPPYHFVRDA